MINKLREIIRRFPRIRHILNTVLLYLKYPYHIVRGIKILVRLPYAKFLGINFVQPNFIFINNTINTLFRELTEKSAGYKTMIRLKFIELV